MSFVCVWPLSRDETRFVKGAFPMLYWAAVFFVIALVAAVFGFGGIAGGAISIAKILFFIFLILFLVSLIAGVFTGRTPRV